MRVLLVGSGGREHALGWKLAQSSRLETLISLPGNPGLASLGPCLGVIDPTDRGAVAEAALEHRVDLVVIGPEAPLAAGVTDALMTAGVRVWGPTQSAAQLESSKAFAKRIMEKAGVPTAGWGEFTEPGAALSYLERLAPPYVVKADGLAAGKGVIVSEDRTEAEAWIGRCLDGYFGRPAVVIEEFLSGPEVSVFALCSGWEAITLEPARDYKRLNDGNVGPNTGGMGAYSPVTDLPLDLAPETLDSVIKPVLATMEAEGDRYTGFLYAGLVLTENGPQVLEFNCRLGDPETQVVLPRLENDLLDLIGAGLDGSLGEIEMRWSPDAFVDVVLASPGYPEAPIDGIAVDVDAVPETALLFHAGTAVAEEGLVSNGGRVLNVVGRGRELGEARESAYAALEQIEFPGGHYRSDIGIG